MLVIFGGVDPHLNILSAKRSPHLNIGYIYGNGDPHLNVLSAKRSPYLNAGYLVW